MGTEIKLVSTLHTPVLVIGKRMEVRIKISAHDHSRSEIHKLLSLSIEIRDRDIYD